MSVCAGCGVAIPPSNGPRVRKWCSDRCRKRTLYSGECVDCGARLNGSDGNGPNAPTRCAPCAARASGAERKVWTRELIVAAIREWDTVMGHFPTLWEWNPTHARNLGMAPCARYLAEPDRWPHVITVSREFRTWRAGIEAAGFTPRERGQHLNERAAA